MQLAALFAQKRIHEKGTPEQVTGDPSRLNNDRVCPKVLACCHAGPGRCSGESCWPGRGHPRRGPALNEPLRGGGVAGAWPRRALGDPAVRGGTRPMRALGLQPLADCESYRLTFDPHVTGPVSPRARQPLLQARLPAPLGGLAATRACLFLLTRLRLFPPCPLPGGKPRWAAAGVADLRPGDPCQAAPLLRARCPLPCPRAER